MTTTTAIEAARALTPSQIEALPAVSPAQPTICAIFDISPATYYRLLAEDALPVPTFTVGRSRRVLRTEIMRAVGLTENDDSDEVAPSPLPVEKHPTHL